MSNTLKFNCGCEVSFSDSNLVLIVSHECLIHRCGLNKADFHIEISKINCILEKLNRV